MGKLIEKKVTVLYVLKDNNGNTIITPEQQKTITDFKSQSITEECPACDGDGICGGEYCDVCDGNKSFTYYTELKIIPLSQNEMKQLEFRNLTGKKLTEFKNNNPDQIFFTGKVKDWKNIPKEIKAISVDSKGKLGFYSSVSGVYNRYDDEHTDSKKYKGGQYWYYGTSLPGLDITNNYKDLNILVKSNHNAIFYRPREKRIVLDFEQPFDWRIFPPAVTKLFVTFGGMDIRDHTISIVAGSEEIYLRDDNVIWGHGGRTHVNKSFEIHLCCRWINDGTNAYPVYKRDIDEIQCNQMNIEFRNIPLRTEVFVLPKNRSKKIAAVNLKTTYDDKCSRINEHTRLICDAYTNGQYHFWYPEGSKERELEFWLLTNATNIGGTYEIEMNKDTNEFEIHVEGDVHIQNDNTSLKYKFGVVQGTFKFLSKTITSLKNLPSECEILIISHSAKLKKIEIPNTVIKQGILHLQFLDNIKSIGNLNPSIKKINYCYINIQKIDFDEACSSLKIKRSELK